MARIQKKGLDYFPLETDMDQDTKIFILEASLGVKGFGIYIKLLMKIYRIGYYIEWSEREAKIFRSKTGISEDQMQKLFEICFEESLFHLELFEKHRILTSRGIQKRYFDICFRRKKVFYKKEYLLIDKKEYENLVQEDYSESISDSPNNVDIEIVENDIIQHNDNIGTPESNKMQYDVNINEVESVKIQHDVSICTAKDDKLLHDVNIGTQSKVKKSKEKERKEKGEIKEKMPPKEKSNRVFNSEITDEKIKTTALIICKDHFLSYSKGYCWETRDKKCLENLLQKIKISIRQDESIEIRDPAEFFTRMIDNLPVYWKTKKFTIPLIDLNYNEIINEIKHNSLENGHENKHGKEPKYGRHSVSELTKRAFSFGRKKDED